ncbi:8271_t:CDS:2, partial [Funneliformis geosporum]
EKKEISENLSFLQTSHSQVSKNQTINITNGLAMYQFIHELAEANGSKEHATGDCKKELEKLNKSFQERGKKLSDLQEENEKLKSQLAEAKNNIRELEKTTADLKLENERQEREINHLKTKNGELATSQAAETVAITTIENLNNQIKKITEDNRLLNERKQAESKK